MILSKVPSEVAVVVREHGHAVLESRVLDTPLRELVLALRDRCRRDVAAVVRRRVDGEAAPAGADLEHAIAGCKRQEVGQTIELVHGRLGQRIRRPFEHGARVHHRFVEDPLEELVPEVVVGPDVAGVSVLVGAPSSGDGIDDGS